MTMRILREFIRENLGMMFGLDRFVTMNAFRDVVGPPDPVVGQDMPQDNQNSAWVDVTTRLKATMAPEFDELESIPDESNIDPAGDAA